jgi:hypothetical protein
VPFALLYIIISIEPVPKLIVYALKRMVFGQALAVFRLKPTNQIFDKTAEFKVAG